MVHSCCILTVYFIFELALQGERKRSVTGSRDSLILFLRHLTIPYHSTLTCTVHVKIIYSFVMASYPLAPWRVHRDGVDEEVNCNCTEAGRKRSREMVSPLSVRVGR